MYPTIWDMRVGKLDYWDSNISIALDEGEQTPSLAARKAKLDEHSEQSFGDVQSEQLDGQGKHYLNSKFL